MSVRIDRIFERCRAEGRPALIVYVTVGCPAPAESPELIDRLIAAGADIIELGVPFSDPMADGPVIQQAGQTALNAGTEFSEVLKIAAGVRQRHPETGLVLFSYYNVLFSHGLERLGGELRDIGVDGILAVDLPLEERDEFFPVCERFGLDLIPLVSPATSPERAKRITAGCRGFVYYITVRGVTGVRTSLPPELAGELEEMRRILPLPVAAGFGISTPEMARSAGVHADAVVVGSAVMKRVLERDSDGAVELIARIAEALR